MADLPGAVAFSGVCRVIFCVVCLSFRLQEAVPRVISAKRLLVCWNFVCVLDAGAVLIKLVLFAVETPALAGAAVCFLNTTFPTLGRSLVVFSSREAA